MGSSKLEKRLSKPLQNQKENIFDSFEKQFVSLHPVFSPIGRGENTFNTANRLHKEKEDGECQGLKDYSTHMSVYQDDDLTVSQIQPHQPKRNISEDYARRMVLPIFAILLTMVFGCEFTNQSFQELIKEEGRKCRK